MKTNKASIIGLLTLILIAGSAIGDEARAGIRVRATLKTPQVRLHVSNAPAAHLRYVARHRDDYRGRHLLSRRDRAMAQRLSWYTGIPRRELLDLRRHGYTWSEIGRWYDLPRPLVRAAGDQRSWNRWLERDRQHGRRGRDDCRYDRTHHRYHD